MIRYLQFLFITTCLVCVSGCIPVASGLIAYDSAVSEQEHGAYTDYYFTVLNTNLLLKKQGLPLSSVVPEKEWTENYSMKLKYTEYYHDIIAENAKTNGAAFVPITPFEEWQTNEYKQMLIRRKQSFQQRN